VTTLSGPGYFFHGKMTFTLLPSMREPTVNAGLAAIAAVVRLLLHVRATPQPPS
jgi:hypothetical protein